MIVAIPSAAAGLWWALTMGKQYDIEPGVEESYSDLMAKYGKLPSTFMSFLPLVMPIVLILLKSLARLSDQAVRHRRDLQVHRLHRRSASPP